jgi:membrane-bound lytic murein transglycosylase C
MGRVRLFVLIATGCATAAAGGCASMDKALKGADSALNLYESNPVQAAVDIAGSANPAATAKSLAKQRAAAYQKDPRLLLNDIREVRRDYQKLVSLLRGNVDKTWGHKEVKIPTRKEYVKYTQNYLSRAIVDFDKGKVTVETLDQTAPKTSLKNAITTTLLTPDDPRSVDLFSDKQVVLKGDRRPYLYNLVLDRDSQPIDTPASADRFADYLVSNKTSTRTVDVTGGNKTATYVTIDMVKNFEDRQAQKYQPMVTAYAEKYRVSKSLIFAIMKTESNFNPYAVSSAPAYGLMQLVPTSGAREGSRKALGRDESPSKDTLFDPQMNIQLGSAYLSVLMYDQLGDIADHTSREYCVISAYNTGTGNVMKAFSKDRGTALAMINKMSAPDVYARLKSKLPYQETRQYLPRVVQNRKGYVQL